MNKGLVCRCCAGRCLRQAVEFITVDRFTIAYCTEHAASVDRSQLVERLRSKNLIDSPPATSTAA